MVAAWRGRRSLILSLLCVAIIVVVPRAYAQKLSPDEAERLLVGTYELTEWRFEGQVLKPPAVHGRLVFHNGQIIAMFQREKDGTLFDFSGYGSYVLNENLWSYGFDYRLEVTGKAGGNEVLHATREQIPFLYRREGTDLVLDYRNGERRFVIGPEELSYFEMGQVLRKWRRLKTGL